MIELDDDCIACGSDQIRDHHIVPEAKGTRRILLITSPKSRWLRGLRRPNV